MPISRNENDAYLILYREVKSENEDLKKDIIDEDGEVRSVDTLLSDVRNNVESLHKLDDLDTSNFFTDWVTTILSNSDDIQNGLNKELENYLEYMAEDFSDSMLSRARESGKYVVFIISQNMLIVCHSFTGEKALTTDMDVIEELLSTTNIDKFAEFEFDIDDEIVVNHFDRHDTQSFTDWLGIPEDEIAFDVKGDIRVYTSIDDIDVVFEFDQEDITSKLLGSDDYDFSNGMLQTPNEKPRHIDKIRWGHSVYTDVSDFKNELVRVNHNLKRAFKLYDDKISDSLDSFFDVEDHEDNIVKFKQNNEEVIRKPNVDFELSYVNSQVVMEKSWRKELANEVFTKRDPIPICHAGSEFSEEPLKIGNFRIYNKTGLSSTQQTYTTDLLKTANDLGSDNLRPLFLHIVFTLLSKSTPKPLSFLFDEFSQEFNQQFVDNIQDGTRVIQTEGEDIDLEWKSPPWFDRQSGTEEIARGINREFQNCRLLLLGIKEDAREINAIDSGISDEKLGEIEKNLEQDHGVEESHVWSVPIDGGHVVIALNVSDLQDYSGDLGSLFEEVS